MKNKFSFILIPIVLFILTPAIIADSNNQENDTAAANIIQKIAFISKRDGNFEIYTMNEDGTELKRLTNNKNDDLMPQWSADGTKLLYLSKKGSKYELWIMHNDSSGQLKLANECIMDYPPLWSPDSSKILFTSKVHGRNAIFVVNTDGSDLVRLSENELEGLAPSWSPNGTKILFLQKIKGDTVMFQINPDGTGREKMIRKAGVCSASTWSPDGRKIAYIFREQRFIGTTNKLYVMNSDGNDNVNIADVSKQVEKISFNDDLCWSPDGNNIAFTKVARVDGKISDTGGVTYIFNYGTYIVAADGNSNENQLEVTGKERANPIWSPDSSKVAYFSGSKINIYTLKSGIFNNIQVRAAILLSPIQWSPDGHKILFAAKNSSFQKSGVYLVDIDGKVTKLTEAGDYDPVWAPTNTK